MTTTTVPESMTRQATVAEASQVAGRDGSTQWALKLEIHDISQYPTPCFMPLERASQVLKGSTHLVTMRRGKLKQGKEGKYPSEFFWDLVHWDVQAPPPSAPEPQQPPQGGGQAASEPPRDALPPAKEPWDYADTQARISWAQAVNLGVEATGAFIPAPDDSIEREEHRDVAKYLGRVNWLANHFYPLIRKGPTPQVADPVPMNTEPSASIGEEPLFPDAPEDPQEAVNAGWEPAEPPQAAPARAHGPGGKPYPLRGEKETDSGYFVRVARESCGKSIGEAYDALGKNLEGKRWTWTAWTEAGHTLQDALDKLPREA